MSKNHSSMPTFKMEIENESSFLIKKVYPEGFSDEEIEKEERNTPRVILHCFDRSKVLELQNWGEKIIKQQLALEPVSVKSKSGFFKSIRNFLF